MAWSWEVVVSVTLLTLVSLASGVEEGTSCKSYHVLLASVHELSHIKPLTAIAKELVRRGHQVTFAAPDSCLIGSDTTQCPMTTRAWMATHLPKAQYLPTGQAVPFVQKEVELAALAERQPLRAVFKILSMMSDMNEPLLSTLLTEYGNSTTTTASEGAAAAAAPSARLLPDIMIVDTLSHAAVDAAEKLGVPVMFNNPLPLWHDLLEPQGMMVPVHAFPRSLESLQTFGGRIGNFFEHCIWLGIGIHGAMLRNTMRDKYGMSRLGYTPQLALRASHTERDAWILQNTVFGLDVPRLMEPRVFMVGPIKLGESDGCTGTPKDCKAAMAWLNLKARKTRPVLYVNIGVLQQPPAALVDSLYAALTSVRQSLGVDVLWALDDASRERLGAVGYHFDHLITSAVPEVLVLSHPRVSAVVSHCTFEAISHALSQGLPIIGLPTRGNQAGLCTMAENAGVATCHFASLKNVITAPMLEEAVREVVVEQHGRFKAKADKIAKVMKVAGGAERAADLIELALTVGLEHVRDTRVTMDWFVGSMADVRLGIFAMVLLVYCAITLAIRLFRRLARRFHKLYRDIGDAGVVVVGGNDNDNSRDREAAAVARRHQEPPRLVEQQNGTSSGGINSSRNGPVGSDSSSAAAGGRPHHD